MKKIKGIRLVSVFSLAALFMLLNSCFNYEMAEPKPQAVPTPEDYEAISAGYGHSLALSNYLYLSYKSLWAWGDNSYGQLGDHTKDNKNIPVLIGHGYTAISAGGSHSLALKNDTLFAWGDNRFGQLGDSTYSDKSSPVKIGFGYSAISAGFSHSLALKNDGTLWAWGENTYGQLGDGTNENRNSPVQIGSGYSAIAAGGRHSLALKTDATLWAWGNNEYGQLGDGTNQDKNTPVRMGFLYSKIAAGGRHSLALKKNDTMWAWGNNEYGQLGDSTHEDRNMPVRIYSPILGNYSVYEIAAGESHSLFLGPNGMLWAWGRNDVGQSGGGTYEDRDTLAQIGSGYIGITAGGNHSFALKEVYRNDPFLGPLPQNHLYAWGDNHFGQLGCGPTPAFWNAPIHIGPN